MFSCVHLCEIGLVTCVCHDIGDNRSTRIILVGETALPCVEEQQSSSKRGIARCFCVSHSTVGRILKKERLHPFYFQRVHLLQADYLKRVEFYQGSRRKLPLIPNFLRVSFPQMKLLTFLKVFSTHTIRTCGLLTTRKIREAEMHNIALPSMRRLG